MKLILSNIDALNYWRQASLPEAERPASGFVAGSAPGLALRRVPAISLNHVAASTSQPMNADTAMPRRRSVPKVEPPSPKLIEDLRSMGFFDASEAHVLVTSPSDRRRFRGINCSVSTTPLPPGSLLPVYHHEIRLEGIYVCSPMLALQQLASGRTLAENILLALEACGTFRVLGDEARFCCRPLVTAREYRLFSARTQEVAGAVHLRQAARWVEDGSASPVEAAIVTALALPLARGGYGLGMPKLNATMRLSSEATQLLGYSTITPDARWSAGAGTAKAGVVLEYDSGRYHSEEERLERDQRRRNAYSSMGLMTVVMRPEHIRDFAKFDAAAKAIRKGLGIKVYHLPTDYSRRHFALLAQLLGPFWSGPEY